MRGGTAKRYRHDPVSGEHLSSGDSDELRVLMAALSAELIRRAARYEPSTPFAFTDAEVHLSSESWGRVQKLAREVGRVIHDEAVPDGTPGARRIGATMALFAVTSLAADASVN